VPTTSLITKCTALAGDHGIRISGGSRVRAFKCTLQQQSVAAVKLDDAPDVVLDGLVILDQRRDGIRTFDPVDGVTVTRCVLRVSEDAIQITGADAVVTSNKILLAESGITVIGALALVAKNRSESIVGGGRSAITISGAGGLVEKNVCRNSNANAVHVLGGGNGITLRDNVAVQCGIASQACFRTEGTGTTTERCRAIEGFGAGFSIADSDTLATDCVALRCARDGFNVSLFTTNATLERCVATQCGGEGFDNRANGTTLKKCIAKQNRLDLANEGHADAECDDVHDRRVADTVGNRLIELKRSPDAPAPAPRRSASTRRRGLRGTLPSATNTRACTSCPTSALDRRA
jgi:hypothetical protein